MARKRSPLRIRSQNLDYQWECLKRNPDFRGDYKKFKQGCLSDIDLCDKWRLDFAPDNLNETENPLGDSDVPVRLLDVIEGKATISLVEPRVKLQATKDDESNTFRITGRNESTTRHTFKVPANEKRVIVALNPHQPLRLILEGIKLRPWEGRKKNAKAERAKRNTGLRLEVYDLYRQGKKHFEIAKVLRKSISTVYNLLASVCKDIGLPKSKRGTDPSFDHKEHYAGCPSCRKGLLCRLAETKMGLGLQESRTVLYNESFDIAARERQGRKLPPKIDY